MFTCKSLLDACCPINSPLFYVSFAVESSLLPHLQWECSRRRYRMGNIGGGLWAHPEHRSPSPQPLAKEWHLPWLGKVQAPQPALALLVLLPLAMGDPGDLVDSFAWSWFLGKSSKLISQLRYESPIFSKIKLSRKCFFGSSHLPDSFWVLCYSILIFQKVFFTFGTLHS